MLNPEPRDEPPPSGEFPGEEDRGEAMALRLRRTAASAGLSEESVAELDRAFRCALEKRARDADAEAMGQAWVAEHQQERDAMTARLTAYLARLPAPFRDAQPLVAEGNPAERILETIAADKTDLAIVGKTAAGPLRRLLLGSTSERVLSHAPCSVLVVPIQERP